MVFLKIRKLKDFHFSWRTFLTTYPGSPGDRPQGSSRGSPPSGLLICLVNIDQSCSRVLFCLYFFIRETVAKKSESRISDLKFSLFRKVSHKTENEINYLQIKNFLKAYFFLYLSSIMKRCIKIIKMLIAFALKRNSMEGTGVFESSGIIYNFTMLPRIVKDQNVM